MKAMILAAGGGTRLRPYTQLVPKAMLPVNGRPTIEWIVMWLHHYGIDEIAINLHHQPGPVIEHLGDGRRWGVRIVYSVEDEVLGTAGGVRQVGHLFEGSFVVAYGDVLTDMNLSELVDFHRARGDTPHLTLSLYHAPNPWDCGILEVDEQHRVTRFQEKPARDEVFSSLTNAGILVVDPQIVDAIPIGMASDIAHDLLPNLLRRGIDVFAQPVDEKVYLIDIGTPEKYEKAQREWAVICARGWPKGGRPDAGDRASLSPEAGAAICSTGHAGQR